MKTKLERFMAQTIKSHELSRMDIVEALPFASYRSISNAYDLAENTSYFERKDILLTEAACNPNINLVNSFKKWLALQKHDVKAVNSLYAHKKAVAEKLYEVYGNIGELEELPEVMRPFVEPTIKRLEQDAIHLSDLRRALSAAIEAVKSTGKAKAVAA